MREFKTVTVETAKLDKISCNICGRAAKINSHGYTEDFLSVDKQWSYNSGFDGEVHSFDICPECYQKLIEKFVIPIRN